MDIVTDISTYSALTQNAILHKNFCDFAQFTGSNICLIPSLQFFDISRYKSDSIIERKINRTPYITLIGEELFSPGIKKNRGNKFIEKFLSSDFRVNLYSGIEGFLIDCWPKVSFINDAWFSNNFDYDHFDISALKYLNEMSKSKMLNWLNAVTEQTITGFNITSYYHLHDSYGDRSVFELSKNIYRICFPMESEIKIAAIADHNIRLDVECFVTLNLDLVVGNEKILDIEIASVCLEAPSKNVANLLIY